MFKRFRLRILIRYVFIESFTNSLTKCICFYWLFKFCCSLRTVSDLVAHTFKIVLWNVGFDCGFVVYASWTWISLRSAEGLSSFSNIVVAWYNVLIYVFDIFIEDTLGCKFAPYAMYLSVVFWGDLVSVVLRVFRFLRFTIVTLVVQKKTKLSLIVLSIYFLYISWSLLCVSSYPLVSVDSI